jgi:hypothetical protein
MSALKSLTFTTIPKIGANPTLDRRTNIIARLEERDGPEPPELDGASLTRTKVGGLRIVGPE